MCFIASVPLRKQVVGVGRESEPISFFTAQLVQYPFLALKPLTPQQNLIHFDSPPYLVLHTHFPRAADVPAVDKAPSHKTHQKFNKAAIVMMKMKGREDKFLYKMSRNAFFSF